MTERSRVVDVTARRSEADVIQCIEELSTEIEVLPLRCVEPLADREVKIEEAWSPKNTHTGIAERTVSRSAECTRTVINARCAEVSRCHRTEELIHCLGSGCIRTIVVSANVTARR